MTWRSSATVGGRAAPTFFPMKPHKRSVIYPLLGLLWAVSAFAQQRPFLGNFVHTQQNTVAEIQELSDNPYLTGFSTKIGWDVLETADGQYNWAALDDALEEAAKHGKKINLGIVAASHTPTWLFSTSDTTMRGIEWFEDIVVNKPVDYAPLPWNAVYMREFDEFVRDLAAYLKSRPYYWNILTVAVHGGNYLSEEMFSPPVADFSGTIPCSSNPDQDVARRRIESNGSVTNDPVFSISPTTVVDNWKHWIDLFAREFPDKELRLVISKCYTGDSAYESVVADTLSYLVTNYGSRAVVQTDSLHGREDALFNSAQASGTDEYELMTSYNTTTPTLPTAHETIGGFHHQPYRQGRAGMTVYNHKSFGHPYYLQMWISDCDDLDDPVFAQNLLRAWYQYGALTPAQIKTSLQNDGLYIEETGYQRPMLPCEAFDQVVATAANTAVEFTLAFTDETPPAGTNPCTGLPSTNPSAGPYSVQITTQPQNGTLQVLNNATGLVRYTPNTGFVGVDTIRWEVDDSATTSNMAIASIEVGPQARAPYFLLDPIARVDSGLGLTNQMSSHATAGASFTFNVNFATDANGGSLTYTKDAFLSGPSGGSDWLSSTASNGQNWSGTASSVSGQYRWRVKVTDSTSRVGYTTLVVHVQGTSNLAPTHDAHVNEANPTANGNSSTEINLKTATGQTRRGYLKFNVSGITGDIVSAKLKLRCLATQSGSTTSVYRVLNTAWTETALTWQNQPADLGNGTAVLVDTENTPAAGNWVEFDVTGQVGRSGEVTFALVTNASGFVKYYPEESASDPVLEIVHR